LHDRGGEVRAIETQEDVEDLEDRERLHALGVLAHMGVDGVGAACG
jgi:hypothetical protein